MGGEWVEVAAGGSEEAVGAGLWGERAGWRTSLALELRTCWWVGCWQ